MIYFPIYDKIYIGQIKIIYDMIFLNLHIIIDIFIKTTVKIIYLKWERRGQPWNGYKV